MLAKKYTKWLIIVTASIYLICFSNTDSWSMESSSNVHWIFCIDTSGSMKEKGHVDFLNLITKNISEEFIHNKKNIIKIGDRITVFSFDQDVRLETTALYQTESDIRPIEKKLKDMNKRSGQLTFISEAIVQSIDFSKKYSKFFQTNALYVFTDGKSEPYSHKWPKEKIDKAKKRDIENFKRISLVERDNRSNIWVGALKWDAFNDAKSLVKKLGKAGHFVDLTDFDRLPLEKALLDFAESVRSYVKISPEKNIDLGTIPYKSDEDYHKNVSFSFQTDRINKTPSITAHIDFDPDNPSEISKEIPIEVKTADDKMILNFQMKNTNELKPGVYRGKLRLFPSKIQFGTLIIEPTQMNVEFKKSGVLAFVVWRILFWCVIGIPIFVYMIRKIRSRMPIKV